MLQLVLYFTLNGLGFLFFLFVWNRIPKVRLDRLYHQFFPKPFDYTTIPGLKLEIATAEELPPYSIEPGTSLSTISSIPGHLRDVRRFPHHRQFLEYLKLCFGALNSFYWGPRYVISVASEELVQELQKYQEHLLAACPIAFGSILNGDNHYWSKILNVSLEIEGPSTSNRLHSKLLEKKQNKIFSEGPKDLIDEVSIDVVEAIRQVPLAFKEDIVSPKSIREVLSRPLTVVFNEEIELDAHPVPKYIPIIIHTGGLVLNWKTEDIWEKFYRNLSWVPGVDMLKTLERDIETKIRRETRR